LSLPTSAHPQLVFLPSTSANYTSEQEEPYTVHEDAVALDQNMEYVELPAEEQLQTTSPVQTDFHEQTNTEPKRTASNKQVEYNLKPTNTSNKLCLKMTVK
jgi:hypothetical protein